MRIALLGTSHWHAGLHAQAVSVAGAEIVASWDGDGALARAFAGRFGLPVQATFEAALAEKPDLCVVMGHPRAVSGLARRLIAAEMPMILEKPAVTDTATLTALAAAAGDLFIAVPLANRLSPAMTAITGRVAHASFRIVNGPPQRYRDDGVAWVLEPAAGGGGALRNLGLHGIDCALGLAQGRLRVVAAAMAKRIHGTEAVEDHALVMLTDEAGAVFTVEAGYTYASMAPGGDFERRVVTDNAYLVDRGETASVQHLGATEPEPLPPVPDRYGAFMADTIARLRAGRKPRVGIADYRDAMALIDDAYAMARP